MTSHSNCFAYLALFAITCAQASFDYDAELLTQVTDLIYNPTSRLELRNAVNLNPQTDFYLPFSLFSEGEYPGSGFSSSPYLVKVTIKDQHGQEVSEVIRRSVIFSGIQPVLSVDYLIKDGAIDGGNTNLKLHGLQSKLGDETNSSWLFPLPVNSHTYAVVLKISPFQTETIKLKGVRKIFYVIPQSHLEDPATQSQRPAENNFEPNIVALALTAVTEGAMLSFSSDEFQTSINKQFPGHTPQTACSTSVETVLSIGRNLLYFGKQGIYLLTNDDSGSTMLPVQIEGRQFMCTNYVSQSEFGRTVFASIPSNLYSIQFPDFFDVKSIPTLQFDELVDSDGQTFQDFLGYPINRASIAAHASYNDYTTFILFHDNLYPKYILLTFTGHHLSGTWDIFVKFQSKLPNVDDVTQTVFFSPNLTYQGISIDLKGLNFPQKENGYLYLWGNVILACDIRSREIAAFPLNDSNLHLPSGELIKQFASQKAGNQVAMLSNTGKLWRTSFLNFFSKPERFKNPLIVSELLDLPLSDVLGVFYDHFGDLFIVFSNSSKVSRHFVPNPATIPDINMLSKFSCNNYLLHSRSCNYVFHEPNMWPGLFNPMSGNHNSFSVDSPVLPSADNNLLQTYRGVVQKLFDKQKIGESFWWRSELSDNKKNSHWFVKDPGYEDYLQYLSVNNLQIGSMFEAHFSKSNYIKLGDRNFGDCVVPAKVYLDKDQQIRITITLYPGPQNVMSSLAQHKLFVELSCNDVVQVDVVKYKGPLQTTFEVVFTGLQLPSHSSGTNLRSVDVQLSPWALTENVHQTHSVDFTIEGGCPPALSLVFDRAKSIELLASRGRTDDFECLYEAGDGIPCFTTSEFATAFYVKDHVTGMQTPFTGNYTLTIVKGGIGYHDNVKDYSQEEINMYNYRPGDSKSLQSLMWTVLNADSTIGMKDNISGRLIFNALNPPSIVFECRIDSPCGSIPFGSPNPSEFYVVIEVSNRGVDSSTNCDFTAQFEIHLIGIELNAKSHFIIMLVTLSIICTCILLFYQLTDGPGIHYIERLMDRFGKKAAEPPVIKIMLPGETSTDTLRSMASEVKRRGTVNRSSLLNPVLTIDRSVRRRSIAAVESVRRQSVSVRGPNSIGFTLNRKDSDISSIGSLYSVGRPGTRTEKK